MTLAKYFTEVSPDSESVTALLSASLVTLTDQAYLAGLPAVLTPEFTVTFKVHVVPNKVPGRVTGADRGEFPRGKVEFTPLVGHVPPVPLLLPGVGVV